MQKIKFEFDQAEVQTLQEALVEAPVAYKRIAPLLMSIGAQLTLHAQASQPEEPAQESAKPSKPAKINQASSKAK